MVQLDKFKVAVIFIFAIPIGAWEFTECMHIWHARSYPIVEGDILRREEFRRWGGIPAGRLTIQLVNSKIIVVAEVKRYQMDELPRRVRFHYSGNPSNEVFLEGEDSPVWIVLFMWVSPFLLLAVYLALRGRPGWGHVVRP